jgi:NDP-sugar pyrophosphorylase family protein
MNTHHLKAAITNPNKPKQHIKVPPGILAVANKQRYTLEPSIPYQAIILAGGKGSRLQPLTQHLPKPLMPIEGKPILEWLLIQLQQQGFSQVTLALGHEAHKIQSYFGDGNALGLHIEYCKEAEPLGTAGPLRLVPELPENFLVLNADILTTLDFNTLLTEHIENQRMATVAVHRHTVKNDYGVVQFSSTTGEITQFEEKPTTTQFINMGIYAFNRTALAALPHQLNCGIDGLLKNLQQQQHAIHAFTFDGYWLDIGRPSAYQQAMTDAPKVLPLITAPTNYKKAMNVPLR